MFAVRRALCCFAKRLPSVAPNFDRPLICFGGVSKQFPSFSTPSASFSCSNYFNSVVSKTERQETPSSSTSSHIESGSKVNQLQTDSHTKSSGEAKPESESDVLYHKVVIETRCADPAVLNSYNVFIDTAAKCLDLTTLDDQRSRTLKKPYKKRWTVLKSKFVHRKHLVTYEVRTYHHIYSLLRITGSTADTFLEYIQRNLPEGVSMRVERVRMEKLPEHLLTPPSSDS